MATIQNFEEMEIWQLARQLNRDVYPLLEKLYDNRHFKLKEQLDSSVGSVMDNISEDFERDGNREFSQYLSISKGSLGEVRSQLYRAYDRTMLSEIELEKLQSDCKSLVNKIGKFMTYLRNSEIKGRKFKNNQLETRNN
jgi:four helix bundle protein